MGQGQGFQGGANTSLAVGSGNMKTAEPLLGRAHICQQTDHAVQLQLHVGRVFFVDVVQEFLIVHVGLQ